MTRCQHLVHRASKACPMEVLENGWCGFHQAGYETMEAGRLHRYQELTVNGSLIIMAGFYQWLAYAVVATDERVRQIKEAIFERMYSRK